MSVSLHTSAHPAAVLDAVFLPWLENAALKIPRGRRVTAVLVPFRSHAYFLKARALAAGVPLLGVHFLTPGELRDRLARQVGTALRAVRGASDSEAAGAAAAAHIPPATSLRSPRTARSAVPTAALPRVPLREHLHLLLAAAAERGGAAGAGVAASPDVLLKAIDLLSAGGWDFADAGPVALRPVVAEFERLVGRAGFRLMHDADRALLTAVRVAEPHFAALFITGFEAQHWPLWPLLAAAAYAAESATVMLSDPRPEAEALDAAWIGTWEETFGAASQVPAEAAPPAEAFTFLVGHNTAEHAQAIVAQALHFLADPACERLGILFPAAGALSRRVAALLAERAVPHDDGLAHQAPGPLEDAAWPAWLALQESPRLPALLRLLRAQPEKKFAGLPLAVAEDALTRVFNDLLIDDLAVVAEYLAHHPRKRHATALAASLRALPFLPERATLAEFIEKSDAVFRSLGWAARADELARLAADWRDALPLAVSRRAWLRWLRETLVSWRTERAADGNHPYSRVHLLPSAQAEAQAWTHLIVAGLNEGRWPPAIEDSGFLGEEEIDALNRRIRVLNQRATAQGSQGEGHETVQPGKSLCLGPAQRRDLALRQFLNILESATVAVAATAQLFDEAAPDRRLNPSDFFNRLNFRARGRSLSQDAMSALRDETARWLAAGGLWKKPTLADAPQTRAAFTARRDAARPFGEYEFAFRTPPAPLRLSATDWERVFASPALVWMGRVLGVSARDAGDETPWSLAAGQWVHAWLRAISDAAEPGAFAPMPPTSQIFGRVHEHALAFRERVRAVLRACDREVPDWWLSSWQQAQHLAGRLAQRVAAVESRTHLATEWTLADTAIPLGEGAALHVHGRVDLLLTNAPAPDGAWIVDYKTGNRKPLTVKKLRGGDGVQLALYALALRAQGVSLLTPDLALDAPQLMLDDLTAQSRLWRGLHRMQESGVFGMRGALRDEFSFRGDYPLATLGIDVDILDEKWTRTHPDLCAEEEG